MAILDTLWKVGYVEKTAGSIPLWQTSAGTVKKLFITLLAYLAAMVLVTIPIMFFRCQVWWLRHKHGTGSATF